MPDQPANWFRLISFLSDYWIAIQGAFMAFVVAILRILYDGHDHGWRARLLDATLCAVISAPIGYVLLELGMGSALTIPIASFVGLLGVDWLRETATHYFRRRQNKRKEK